MHELSGVLAARQVTQCGHGGHRHRARDPAQGLERLDDRLEAPGVPLRVACECKTPQTCSLCSNSLDVFLQDHGGAGVGQITSLSQRRWAGLQLARPVERISCRSTKAVRRTCGCLQGPPGLFPRPTQGAAGCIVDRRDRDGGEGSRAQEPSQWPSSPTGGCDPVARPCGQQGGGDAPSSQSPVASESAKATSHTGQLRRQRPGVWPSIGASASACRCHTAACHKCRGRRPRRRDLWQQRRCDGVCMDIHANGERARRCHG